MVLENVDDVKRKSSIMAHSVINILMSSANSEKSESEATDESIELETVIRNTSLLQRFVHAIFLNNEGNDHDGSAEESQGSETETETETTSERLRRDLITQVESLDQDDKKSLVMRVLDGFVHMVHGCQPETSAANIEREHLGHGEGSENQDARSCGDEPECSAYWHDINETKKTGGKNEHSESTDTEDNKRDEATSRNARQRKRDGERKSSIIAHSFIDFLVSSTESDEGMDEATNDKEPETVIRKTSLLQRFVHALFSNNDRDGHDSSAEEPQGSESCEEKTIKRLGIDLITQVESLDQDGKKSLIIRVLDGFVHMANGRQPETSAGTIEREHLEYGERSENQCAESCKDKPECSACRHDSNEMEKTDRMDEHSEKTDTEDNEGNEATSRIIRQQTRGMSMIPEDSSKLGIFNLGYQNETIGTEIRAEAEEKSCEHRCEVDVHIDPNHCKVQMATSTKAGKNRKESFFDEKQHARDTANEEVDSIAAVCNPALNTFEIEMATLPKTGIGRKVSSFEEERALERTGTVVDSIDVTCKPAPTRSSENRRPKTTKDWLMNPHLYQVVVIFTCSLLVQDSVYVYLPLFLTETLGFGKQSIAYFPLVLLISAALGSTVSDKLSTKIGRKWTYFLASFLVIGGSVYCYFQTHSLRQFTYAPVIVIGSGMSVMYVMALSFATELIGEDKETSGSVFAIVIFTVRVSSGGMVMAIQKFYPENGSDSNVSDYVRHVFSMVPAVLAFVGSLMVLFFKSSSLCSTRKEYSPTKEATLQKDTSTASFYVVVIAE